METLETLRRSINNAEDMHSVVTTMKTLAAVSIRQYEAAVESLAAYDQTVQLAFRILLREHAPTPVTTPHGAVGAVIFGSDQGMCGQFNDQLVRFVQEAIDREPAEISWSLLVVGSRAESRLLEAGLSIDRLFHVPVSVDDITRLVQDVLPRIEHWQSQSGIQRLLIFYNQRTSASSFQSQRQELLPIAPDQWARWQEEPWESRSLPMHRTAWRTLFTAVLREYLFVSLYRACAESLASENASRIASMQAAERNIEDRLAELNTQFHQQRQTAITEELLDVVTGFEALADDD